MSKFKFMSDELYDKYRYDFINFVDNNPQAFSALMTEMLIQFNMKKGYGYQNYIGSGAYRRHKLMIYEMVFRSYARIRMKYDSQLIRLKKGDLSFSEYMEVVKTRIADKICMPYKRLYRSERDLGFVKILGVIFDYNADNSVEIEYLVAKRLSKIEPRKNINNAKDFFNLSKEEKAEFYVEKAKEAVNKLEQNYTFKQSENNEESLEN